jgi:hypothetical protein
MQNPSSPVARIAVLLASLDALALRWQSLVRAQQLTRFFNRTYDLDYLRSATCRIPNSALVEEAIGSECMTMYEEIVSSLHKLSGVYGKMKEGNDALIRLGHTSHTVLFVVVASFFLSLCWP